MLQGLAILAILVAIWTHGLDWIEGKAKWHREAFGAVLAVGGVVLLMHVPFELQPGLTTDLRGSLIALAGFFGGPLIGAVTGLAAAGYRMHLGGVGATAGVISITISTAVGIVGGLLRHGRPVTVQSLLVFAVASSICPLAGSLVLPPAILFPLLAATGPSLATMSFLATMLAGLAMLEAERRREAAQANRFYRGIIDALPEPVNAKDLDGRFLAANPATARQLNASDVASVIGKTDFDFHPADAACRFRADEERVLATGEAETIEQVVTGEDGSRVWLSTLKAPLRSRAGAVIGLLTHNHDITERKRMEDEIAEGRRRLDDAMEHMADGLVMFDPEGRIVLCNDQYRTMFPATADLRVPGTPLAKILRAAVERGEQTDVAEGAVDVWIERTLASLSQAGERDIHLADGRWLTSRRRPTADGGTLAVIADVTEMKRSEADLTETNQRLTSLASEDGLTGLMNRRGYDDALQRACAQSRRSGTPLSLLLVDVDHFKAYNDTYGHPAGDGCLRTIGTLLKLGLRRPGDVVARYGGEEFAAILPDTPQEAATMLAERLRQMVHGLGMEHSGTALGVLTVSIGVATAPAGCARQRYDTLAGSADAALYAAKAAGRNRTVAAKPDQPAADGA
jgi:diguanylate cyclase (GGDEF)-like protein/PAS domain S-box-containing protein